MGEKNVRNAAAIFDQRIAEIADACPGIQNKVVLPRLHFNAAGIASIFHVRGGRTGDASPDSPESKLQHYFTFLTLRLVGSFFLCLGLSSSIDKNSSNRLNLEALCPIQTT